MKVWQGLLLSYSRFYAMIETSSLCQSCDCYRIEETDAARPLLSAVSPRNSTQTALSSIACKYKTRMANVQIWGERSDSVGGTFFRKYGCTFNGDNWSFVRFVAFISKHFEAFRDNI
jgi:hypothetical protein